MAKLDLSDTVIVMTADGIGQGDDALRHRLVVSWLRTLQVMALKPRAIVFYTEGVRMVVDGSPCLDELRQLAAVGVRLVACRASLDYYGLTDQVAVGEIGNVAMIVELQAAAPRVLTV
jgi:intracellular sulfur oxidation DsrE/DsrF family protein